MKVAFAGTPGFAQLALAAIGDAGHEVVLVLTQPDRPAGRGLKLQPSAVKRLAMQRGWPVAQPRSLRLDGKAPEEAAAARKALLAARADVLVVAAYGLILPQWTLDLLPLGCLNIHASLLPRWRGAAPIQRSIEAGDAKTGITLMLMESGLDTGPMLRTREVEIAFDDNAATLHDRLAGLGAEMIVQALPDWAAGRIVPTPQPDLGITYAAKIEKAEALIDWSQAADRIEHRVRAFDPFPGMHFQIGGENVKLWRATVVDAMGRPGEVLSADGRGLIVACAQGALSLLELQRSGGRRNSTAEFLRGLAVRAGSVLGTAAH